jgi:hypothetical protein
MPPPSAHLQSINLTLVGDAVTRLRAASAFVEAFHASHSTATAESAVLQLRKALESIAFASIAPNKTKYETFRAKAEDQPDYTKDYHAGKILRVLEKINKNFYPLPLTPAHLQSDGVLHFGRKSTGYLTKKRFESIYDRLGKHLHADNPWSTNKNFPNLLAELPTIIDEALGLIELHATVIQTPEFNGLWVVEAPRDGSAPRVITGKADGEFVIKDA